jgi:hypothetical protein
MSVEQTHRTGKPRFRDRSRYKPLSQPEQALAPDALAAHVLAWLLSNMDWLMQKGTAAQSRAVVALHRDLLRLSGQDGAVGTRPAAAQAPPRPTLEMSEMRTMHNVLHEEFETMYTVVIDARQLLCKLAHELGHETMQRPEIHKPFKDIQYLLGRVTYRPKMQ